MLNKLRLRKLYKQWEAHKKDMIACRDKVAFVMLDAKTAALKKEIVRLEQVTGTPTIFLVTTDHKHKRIQLPTMEGGEIC